MNLNKLRYLRLIVAHGSFEAAARVAGVSQPSITRAMSTLEAELGVVLFERAGRRKVATSAAHHMARHANEFDRQVGRTLNDIPSEISADDGSTPLLRAGLAPAAALLYGPSIEAAWRQLQPGGCTRLSGGSPLEHLEQLREGRLDLAIVPRPRGYDTTALQHHAMHVTAPAIHARRGHPLTAATSLTETTDACWAIAGRVGGAGNSIEEALRVRGLPPPRVVADCTDYMTLLHLVAHSDLLCVVPHPVLLASSAAARDLVQLPMQEGLPRYEVTLFWRRWQADTKAGARLNGIERLVQALKPLSSAEQRIPARLRPAP